jgi:hypothetical protein
MNQENMDYVSGVIYCLLISVICHSTVVLCGRSEGYEQIIGFVKKLLSGISLGKSGYGLA